MKVETEIHDREGAESRITVDDAVALSACVWHGACAPKCRHCSATQEEIEAARRWLACHPGSVEAWRAERLGEIATAVRTWEARPLASSNSMWAVRTADGCEPEDVITDLSREHAEAIVRAHNGERERAMTILDWYAGI